MLNISDKNISKELDHDKFSALTKINSIQPGKVFMRLLIVIFSIIFVFMFLPWTQNVRANGDVTTLKPDQRPQTINSIIGGRIEKWYVQEGEYVSKGDTILFISEVKDKYFDPNLLKNTQNQVDVKQFSVTSYKGKVVALSNQIEALKRTAELKLEQTRNKIEQGKFKVLSDSNDLIAAETNAKIAENQFKRFQKLYDGGLKSLTDLENKKNKMQESQAKLISSKNKLLTTRNELLNAKVELNSVKAQYEKDISKAESDRFTALSNQYDAEATVNKLQNEYANYSIRNDNYYITAPVNGYITKAIKVGIGETIKAGADIISIMPADYSLAVALYIDPIDLPLMEKGQEVRIQFDGWPAIVFSGWPNTSYGTYGGKVFAIDNFISDNGKFRVLVEPDTSEYAWPAALRVGGGTNNMLLLKEVPIWYELWRQLNGFPPDFYKTNVNTKDKKK